jgi:hypothetical protein
VYSKANCSSSIGRMTRWRRTRRARTLRLP